MNKELIEAATAVIARNVREYIAKLTTAHAAALAAIEHERSGVEGAMYARILALEAELAKKDTEIEWLKGLLTIYFDAKQEKTK